MFHGFEEGGVLEAGLHELIKGGGRVVLILHELIWVRE